MEQIHTGVRIQVIDVMPRQLIELTVHVYMMLAFDRKEAKLIKLNHTQTDWTGLDTPFPQATLARNSRLYYDIIIGWWFQTFFTFQPYLGK